MKSDDGMLEPLWSRGVILPTSLVDILEEEADSDDEEDEYEEEYESEDNDDDDEDN